MPPATPVTIPLLEPTVATEVVLLVQVPPANTSVSVIVDPAHTGVFPVIAGDDELTVTTVVA